MSIKLVAVDIDGTLLNSKREVTPEVYTAIKMLKKPASRSLLQQAAPLLV